jgi:HD-like signal output (HDOD) protein
MRGSYQLVRFPGNPHEGAVLRELERLELSRRPLPLSGPLLRRFSRLLQAPTLELDCIVRCIERDPLLAVSVLRLD